MYRSSNRDTRHSARRDCTESYTNQSRMSRRQGLEAFALWPISPEAGAIDAGGQAGAADRAVRQEVKLARKGDVEPQLCSICGRGGIVRCSMDRPPPRLSTLRGLCGLAQAACTKLRVLSAWFALIRPVAMASITTSAREQRVSIFVSPRMVCFSKPKLVSRRLLTRSTAVRLS